YSDRCTAERGGYGLHAGIGYKREPCWRMIVAHQAAGSAGVAHVWRSTYGVTSLASLARWAARLTIFWAWRIPTNHRWFRAKCGSRSARTRADNGTTRCLLRVPWGPPCPRRQAPVAATEVVQGQGAELRDPEPRVEQRPDDQLHLDGPARIG